MSSDESMTVIAERVRYAMESVDLELMSELLAPDARWGAPEQDVPTCRNAQQILSWYEMARDNGVRADITEIEIIDDHLLIGLKILANPEASNGLRENLRWQVLTVEDDHICEIRGYEKRREALLYATSGVSNWK